MKLVIDLDETWTVEDTMAECIKDAVKLAIDKEVRKIVKDTVDSNRQAIEIVAKMFAERAIKQAIASIK